MIEQLTLNTCRGEWSSGNLYTFIRSNQEQQRKCNFRSLEGIEPAALWFRCSAVVKCLVLFWSQLHVIVQLQFIPTQKASFGCAVEHKIRIGLYVLPEGNYVNCACSVQKGNPEGGQSWQFPPGTRLTLVIFSKILPMKIVWIFVRKGMVIQFSY
jgi:hypothetical protein